MMKLYARFFAPTLALLMQQPAVVEITSEPTHHQVLQNDYVRVFDVQIPTKTATLPHRHGNDYLFVSFGDADITNAKVGEQAVRVQFKDGEARYTKGGFVHTVTNNGDHTFHNATVELLQPTTGEHACSEACEIPIPCASDDKASCPSARKLFESDQWVAMAVTLPPAATIGEHTHHGPHLVVAVSEVNLKQKKVDAPETASHLAAGQVAWVNPVTHSISNAGSQTIRMVTVEFKVPKT